MIHYFSISSKYIKNSVKLSRKTLFPSVSKCKTKSINNYFRCCESISKCSSISKGTRVKFLKKNSIYLMRFIRFDALDSISKCSALNLLFHVILLDRVHAYEIFSGWTVVFAAAFLLSSWWHERPLFPRIPLSIYSASALLPLLPLQ